jgi:hypothetical protein
MVLMSWYLMLPPPVMPPVKDASGGYKVNGAAPMSQWLKFKMLKSEEACKAKLKQVQPFYKCVPSDDPALRPTSRPRLAPRASRRFPAPRAPICNKFFPSPFKGEDEGEGPYLARILRAI